jgi:hypothetical protein
MSTIRDFAFVVGVFMGPLVALGICLLLVVARQPRRVVTVAVALSAVLAVTWVTYWYLWGKALEYADSYRSVPLALDRASTLLIALCFLLSLMISALGVSRLAIARILLDKPGSVRAN